MKPDGSVPSTSPGRTSLCGTSNTTQDGQGSFWANSELNGNYEDYLLKEVIPWAETNLNANTDPRKRLITGEEWSE